MKKTTLTICALIFFAGFTKLNAQSEAEMKKWMEYMTPGDIHKMIAKYDGNWNAELTMWMAPNTPPTKTTGTCTNTMLLGGRYQQSKYAADMNGMPFEGIGTLAYDNALKKFISTWIDNLGTGVIVMEGTWDDATKSLNLSGKSIDPSTYNEIMMREVFKIVDDNTHIMELYNTMSGKEFKTMEVKLTRKI